MPAKRVTVLGATGKVGKRLVKLLVDRGHAVTAAGRDTEKLGSLEGVDEKRAFDAADSMALSMVLQDAGTVVSCLHARFTDRVIEAAPSGIRRIILTGSTRMYTIFPDRAAEEVRRAQKLVDESPLPCVMVHPTMIYGPDAENNIGRIASHISRFRTVPLPGGESSLIQPVFIEDVAASLAALVEMEERPAVRSIVIAGPRAMTYREMVESIAETIGRKVRVISVPAWLLMTLAPFSRLVPGVPRVTRPEIQRLMENKDFDIAGMRTILKVEPVPFREGLRMSLKRLSC